MSQFIEQVRATFIAQGNAMASQLNSYAADEYNRAAQNWAANVRQSGKRTPAPAVPVAVKAEFDFDGVFALRIVETSTPLQVIDAEALLPKYATDVDAVGGPVGGPIPGQSGRFYQASTDTSELGTVYRDGAGRVYVKRAVSPFNRFWELVA